MEGKDICQVFSGVRGKKMKLVRGIKEASMASVPFYVIIIIKIKI